MRVIRHQELKAVLRIPHLPHQVVVVVVRQAVEAGVAAEQEVADFNIN